MPTTQPIRVLYFAGYGRSGTTVLDIALGQHPAVIGSGEISELTGTCGVRTNTAHAAGPFMAATSGVRSCGDGRKVSLRR